MRHAATSSRFSGALKRERPRSQERALGSRPAKRFNGPSSDDAPEEGELEDDYDNHPPPAVVSSTLPPQRWGDAPPAHGRAKHTVPPAAVEDDEPDVLSEMLIIKPKVAYPFKKKDKPPSVAPPAPPPPVQPDYFDPGDANKERKEPSTTTILPPPHPSLPAPPAFVSAIPKDDDRRGGGGRRETSPARSQRERRHSPPLRRDRSRDRRGGGNGYDEFGREVRPGREHERDDDRYRHHRAHDTWVAPAADDWRTRRDDALPPRDYHRGGGDWDRRGGRDSYYPGDDRHSYRLVSPPPRRYAPRGSSRSPSPSASLRSRPRHRLSSPRSRSPRSRSPRSRSCSRSLSTPRSRTPARPPAHHPSRLPAREALPPTPPPLPDPLARDDIEMDGPRVETAPRLFQPFNFQRTIPDPPSHLPSIPNAALRPRPPPAPLPNHEPRSLPGSVISAAAHGASTRFAPKVKNVLADNEDEDEGEVKEDPPFIPKAKPPFLPERIPLPPPPSSLPYVPVQPPAKPPVASEATPKAPIVVEDAFERKIREMEAASLAGLVPKGVVSPVKEKIVQHAEKPVERRSGIRRSVAQEKAAYGGRAFTGVSRLAMYRKEDKLGEGTFGEVFKAVHTQTKAIVALKRILMHNEFQGVPITAVREIKLLKKLKHPNVVELVDIVMELPSGKDEKGSIHMVFPYMDHDLAGLLENPLVSLQPSQIKLYMKQLLEGTAYLHRNNILHRDIKAANLLISNNGSLKIADFGLARPISKEWADKRGYTNCVVTRWYRPPELLLGAKVYSGAVDMWGCGCILAEMFERKPILMGESDMGQLDVIFQLCGSPNEGVWPGWKALPGCEGYEVKGTHTRNIGHRFRMLTNETCDLIIAMLALDPARRITADDALDHPYFWTDPLPADPKNMPNWTASKEYDRRKKAEMQHQQQRAPPPVHYQPQQPPGGFNVGRPHHSHSGLSNPNYNRGPGGGGGNHNSHGRNNNPPPPRMQDGLPPPGVTLPGGAQRGFNGARPPVPAALPPIRWDGGGRLPPSLPPPPPPSQGLPDPAFGGERGYNGPLVRGGKHPERPYSSGGAQRYGGGGGGGGNGRREPDSRSRGGGGALPYD